MRGLRQRQERARELRSNSDVETIAKWVTEEKEEDQ